MIVSGHAHTELNCYIWHAPQYWILQLDVADTCTWNALSGCLWKLWEPWWAVFKKRGHFMEWGEKSTVISKRLRGEGASFHCTHMDRIEKVLSSVGACTANTETDSEQWQMQQIQVIWFLCPSRGDAKVRKTRFISSILCIFYQLVRGGILVFN